MPSPSSKFCKRSDPRDLPPRRSLDSPPAIRVGNPPIGFSPRSVIRRASLPEGRSSSRNFLTNKRLVVFHPCFQVGTNRLRPSGVAGNVSAWREAWLLHWRVRCWRGSSRPRRFIPEPSPPMPPDRRPVLRILLGVAAVATLALVARFVLAAGTVTLYVSAASSCSTGCVNTCGCAMVCVRATPSSAVSWPVMISASCSWRGTRTMATKSHSPVTE